MKHHIKRAFIQRALLISLIPLSAFASTALWAQVKPTRKQAFPSIRQRPWIGVVADPDGKNKGLLVSRVLLTSPAHVAGIKKGDLILQVQGKPVKSIADFRIILRPISAGDTLSVKLLPANKRSPKEVKLKLIALPNQTQLIKSQWMAKTIPAMPFEIVNSKKKDNLKNYRGKITVVEFWATWCGPCKQVASYLSHYQKKHPNKINVIALSSEPQTRIDAYLKKYNINAPYVMGRDDKDIIHKQLMVRSYPTVLILDEKHQLRKVLTGFNHPSDIGKAIDSIQKLKKAN